MPICTKGKLHISVPAAINYSQSIIYWLTAIIMRKFARNFPGNKPPPAIQRCTCSLNNRVTKKNKLLPALIEQALNARNYCICFQIIYIYIYIYKLCLALNDPERLICHKTKTKINTQ